MFTAIPSPGAASDGMYVLTDSSGTSTGTFSVASGKSPRANDGKLTKLADNKATATVTRIDLTNLFGMTFKGLVLGVWRNLRSTCSEHQVCAKGRACCSGSFRPCHSP
jgi:hypothetical protein